MKNTYSSIYKGFFLLIRKNTYIGYLKKILDNNGWNEITNILSYHTDNVR